MTTQAGNIARTVAAREWPDVQRQHKLGKGVFGFSCSGHGGLVAIIGVADLPEAAVQAARETGRVEFIVRDYRRWLYSGGGGVVTPQSAPVYVQDSLREYAAKRPDLEAYEVWVGEEDCDWATIVFANDKLREGGMKSRYFAEGLTRARVEKSVLDWNPDWYEIYTGRAPTGDESYIVNKREWEEANADNFVSRSAWGSWHDAVPEGMVGISTKRERDGAERYFLVTSAEYDTRTENPHGNFVADPDRHQEWVGPDGATTKEVASMTATTLQPRITGADAYVEPDDRDEEILAERVEQLDAVSEPRCGDYVRFADGRLERVSHVFDRETFEEKAGVQTSEDGSFYLGRGYVSFSGGLNPPIPLSELYLTGERQAGHVWFFHHDHGCASNGVRAEVPFRVYAVNGCRQRYVSSRPYVSREWYGDYVPGVTESPVTDLG